ncbi:MAG: sugar ABC transporter permease [Vampirovibrionales bacterium]|nr:sugar ABC transporter permease [Vampirovibrionales bacterium]
MAKRLSHTDTARTSRFYAPWEPYAYLALPLAALMLVFGWPFVGSLGMSLLNFDQNLYAPTWAGFGNLIALLSNTGFQQALWQSGLYLVGIVPPLVLLPVAVAMLVNGNFRGVSTFRILLYLPVVVSMVAVGIAWKWLLQEDGLLNYLLSIAFGWAGFKPLPWLVWPKLAMLSIMAVVIWKGIGYYMMIYLSHLQHLSADLDEAAALDGANLWQRFWQVTLPQLKPAMALVALVSTIGALKLFTEIYVMTRGGPAGTTQSAVYAVYELAFERLQLGQACAAGLLLSALLVTLSGGQWLMGRSKS